jgi:hypothetical protein
MQEFVPQKKTLASIHKRIAKFSHEIVKVKNVMHPFIFWLSTGS